MSCDYRMHSRFATTIIVLLTTVVINQAFPSTYTVTNTSDSATGSLRWAISQANNNPGLDTILFNISGSGPHTIQPLSALPTISEQVVINGFSQSGASPNTNPVDQPCNAVLKIEIDGSLAGSGINGIRIASGISTIRGLVINRFNRVGVRLEYYGANHIEGCIIGMDPTGTISLGNRDGIELTYSSNSNTIGGTTPAVRNIISGNTRYGIQMVEGASINTVRGNFIGTDITGMLDRGNLWAGVYMWTNSTLNTIGGSETGARNVISGNDWYGVRIEGSGGESVILGNYIGTDRTGLNALGNMWDGIRLEESDDNTVGGTNPGVGNVVSSNGWSGITIAGTGSTGNHIIGNFIGTDATGTGATMGNTDNGVRIYDGASYNTVGGTVAGSRNVIAGNGYDGVRIDGREGGATGNLIQGNFIGTDVTGTADLGNGDDGVDIEHSSWNTIGGSVSEARNIISGNGSRGISVRDTTTGNVIEGNCIGTDYTGTSDLGNDRDGIQFDDTASGNTVRNNVISGNEWAGVAIRHECSDNTVIGNRIGSDASGISALGNSDVGVRIEFSPENTIGGTGINDGNLISGNGDHGIYITDSTSTGNVIQGNYIGTDVTGTVALGNLDGIRISNDATGTIVGCTTPGGRNLISGNNQFGISISYTAANTVHGNYIGTDASGTMPLGAQWVGISLWSASRNTVGGTEDSAGNLVSGNDGYGIYFGSESDSNYVIGNHIGVDCSGTGNLGNSLDGIHIENSNRNIIGGIATDAGNSIAFNGDDGIWVMSGVENAILGNSIFSNDSLGINLGDSGVTPNDLGDLDTGANLLQNFPVLTDAQATAHTIAIGGSLNSTPGMPFRIELFTNDTADASLYGEGKIFIGTHTVTTDGSGDAALHFSLDASVPSGSFISATATDEDGNTSEFSQVIMVMGLFGEIIGGALSMEWETIPGSEEYWIYGAENDPNFMPGLTRDYEYRLDVLPNTTTSWSSTSGVEDPESNWTYLVIAVDAEETELNRSNRYGEYDYDIPYLVKRD